jgi:cell division protein FtsW
MNRLFAYTRGDRVIWLVVIMLSVFSLLAVYSSTGTLAYKYQSGNTSYYILKHSMLLLFGFVLMYGAHLIKYTYYSKIAQLALYLAVPMLVFTLLLGTNLNQASRWLTLPGTTISFQTSDFAKLALIMYLARMLSKKQDMIKDFKSAFVPIMAPVLIVCGLILPANLSTAAVLFVTSLFLMFIGRINFKYIFILFSVGAVLLSIFIAIALNSNTQNRVKTWQKRIERFSKGDSEGNYQVEQAKIAIASGGFLGKGPGNSTQRNFLPHPYSDFIFAIILEEYGLAGGLTVVILYLILLYRAIRIVNKSPRAFATLLAVGCTFTLVFQAMINMAVAVHLFPVTGQPLPLLSMGGTSILFTGISIGIVLSISRDIEEEEGGANASA